MSEHQRYQRLSAIVPAYRASAYIDAALASIAAQTRPADEVIVVDDGSDDDTTERAARWSAVLPLVILRSDTNRGLGRARHSGIERATGTLIALVDADDYLLPDHFAQLENLWWTHGGIATAQTHRWWPGQTIDAAPSSELFPIPPPDEQYHTILDHNFLSAASLFSRADYHRAGGFSPRRRSEDWELWIHMIRHGATVCAPSGPTMLYRMRPDSLSAGDGCARADIDLIGDLTHTIEPRRQAILRRTLRRRRARVEYLEGLQARWEGDRRTARERWWRALRLDRSLRGGLRPSGSVTLRSLICLAGPWALVQRSDRLRRRGTKMAWARHDDPLSTPQTQSTGRPGDTDAIRPTVPRRSRNRLRVWPSALRS